MGDRIRVAAYPQVKPSANLVFITHIIIRFLYPKTVMSLLSMDLTARYSTARVYCSSDVEVGSIT